VDQRDLVERARGGDHDAFAVLAGASVARLEAIARLILRDPELARDAVQEAYIRAWRDLRGLRDPERFDAWLHRLTVNACLDATRRRGRRPIEVAIGTIEPAALGDMTVVLANRDLIEQAFAGLEPAQRAVLVLHFYTDLTMPAVAEALGVPLGTAQSRLARALAAMRRSLAAGDASDVQAERRGQYA
jgi:RNA polymerase sigma-70 factor (ECF subfamily)